MTQNSSAKATSTPPGFSQFASFTSAPNSKAATPQPPIQQSAFQPPPANDPFAALGSLSQPISPAPPPTTTNEDDEWSFSSALPPEASPGIPKEHKVTVSNTNLKVDLLAGRTSGTSNSMNLVFAFSNNSAQRISELHWQLAVTKVSLTTFLEQILIYVLTSQGYELQLKPQTGRTLEAKQSRGVTQTVDVWHAGDKSKKVQAIKLRWKVTYKVGGEAKSEMGEIPEFSIA